MASASDTPKRLTDFNHEIASLALGKAEKFEWKGPDGFQEGGVLFYPPDFQKDRKYPLVLVLHDGAHAYSPPTSPFLFVLPPPTPSPLRPPHDALTTPFSITP